MKKDILNFGEQFQIGVKSVGDLVYDVPLNRVIIAGIGGSLIPGEILNMVKPAVKIDRDYDLPPDLDADTLVICISWSGEPEEGISSYHEARRRGLKTLCITKGGKLAELAKQDDTPLIILPQDNIQPRTAIGYMTGALFQVLGLGKELDIRIYPHELENQGKIIAQQISHKNPIIYSPYRWHQLVRFWKILFNENDKIHAFFNTFPGLTHNEIAGFNKKDADKFHVIILKDNHEDPRQNRNIELTIAILDKIGYSYSIVPLSGKTLMEEVMNGYTLGLWTTFYLAEILNVNPESIEVIEDFKRLKNS